MSKYFLSRLAGCLLAVGVLYSYYFVSAGPLTPSSSPDSTGYSLEAVYTRLLTNATSLEASHTLNPALAPGATFHTLAQIYNLIPTIDPERVLLGTSYLGVAGTFDVGDLTNDTVKQGISWATSSMGTLVPNGGTASLSDVFFARTAHLSDDWNLDTGTLTTACAIGTFNGSANLVDNAHDGAGSGSNRWCMTDSGNISAGDVLASRIAWVDGQALTGTMTNVGQQTITPTTSNQTITSGYHDGTGYCEGDPDLSATNIKSGVNLFSVAGSLLPNGGTASASDLFSGKTAQLTGDWTLDTGTLNIACNTSTFNATANLADNAHDGGGDGTNRWCMTDSGTASAGEILSSRVAWVDGQAVTGTMPNIGQQSITPSTANQTITAGYHDGTGFCAGDTDLTAANVKSGVNLFGVTGTFGANIQACPFAGTVGDVYAKHNACTWTDTCKVGVTCTDSCVLNTVNTNTSGQVNCSAGVGLLAAFCDLCTIK